MATWYAHSARRREDWEPLAEHLGLVSERAGRYATAFGASGEAKAAGLLHDLGKYSDLFTRRLEGKETGLDHWSIGAQVALRNYGSSGVAIALVCQGHHIGLQQADAKTLRALYDGSNTSVGRRWTETDPELIIARLVADGLLLPPVTKSFISPKAPASAMLGVRMLFSTLVDADFIETEAHFNRDAFGCRDRRYRPEGPPLEAERALELLLRDTDELARSPNVAPRVLSLRADILEDCLEASDQPQGVFNLSAPTGSGKTRAMLAFALRHAIRHGLRRVVVSIPYLSIIEQTAKVYRNIFEGVFGPGYVLEDHSLTEIGDSQSRSETEKEIDARARLLAQDWDAPLVITTNVQLLDSLFSNRSSPCRKLHQLAKSVVLFDEVQTLPPELAVPTLAALGTLAGEPFQTTVLFATATQPAFDHLDAAVRKLGTAGWKAQEIVRDAPGVFAGARRVQVEWRTEHSTSWRDLAAELLAAERVLCVVNLKRHAVELVERLRAKLGPRLFHLSTNMCPVHRSDVLAKVRGLPRSEPCVLISTQCVEAGVDLDFPVVYRALGPLEAIAQAAGRCNRNGLLGSQGLVHVFVPEEEKYPGGAYEQAATVTKLLVVTRRGLDIDSPAVYEEYFRLFYDVAKLSEMRGERQRELYEAIKSRNFEDVAKLYRLIPRRTISVVVPYDHVAWSELRKELSNVGYLTSDWIRRARPHAVNLFEPGRHVAFLEPAKTWTRDGNLEDSSDWFVYIKPEHYDCDLLGLREAPELWVA